MDTYYFRDAVSCREYTDALVKYILKPYEVNQRSRAKVSAQVKAHMFGADSDLIILGRISAITSKLRFRPEVAGPIRNDNRLEIVTSLLAAATVKLPSAALVVDYGCGDGTITRAMANHFGANCVGIDVGDEPPVEFDASVVEPAIPYANDASMIASGTVDLVTAFVSLHHMHGKLADVLVEIWRILQPGAHLIIREHDLRNPSMFAFLQLVHIIYDRASGTLDVDKLVAETRYYNADTWTDILKTAGFTHLGSVGYSANNPQGLYGAIYMKVERDDIVTPTINLPPGSKK